MILFPSPMTLIRFWFSRRCIYTYSVSDGCWFRVERPVVRFALVLRSGRLSLGLYALPRSTHLSCRCSHIHTVTCAFSVVLTSCLVQRVLFHAFFHYALSNPFLLLGSRSFRSSLISYVYHPDFRIKNSIRSGLHATSRLPPGTFRNSIRLLGTAPQLSYDGINVADSPGVIRDHP